MSYGYGGRPRSGGGGHSRFQRRPFPIKRTNHSRYINTAVEPLPEAEVQVIEHAFTDFGFEAPLLKNVLACGYTTPTPIQDKAIPALMNGRDVVGIANTGTGKTAAFLLPLINKVLLDPNQGVLILAPTRELALQIEEEFWIFAKGLPLSAALCIGGKNIDVQIRRLRDNPHFVIGTPGRLTDLINRRAFDTHLFTNIVLDEVDRMLDIGFRRDIQFLISHLPSERQAAFFSATMTRDAEEIMYQLMTDPIEVRVKAQSSAQFIHQDIVKVSPGQNRVDILYNLLVQEEFSRAIIFGKTKHGINRLEQQLSDFGIRVTSIHGNKNQNARQSSLEAFKRGRVRALLATDIAARGIDVDDVTHVINYDEPQSYEDYIHRIGRTGRAGKYGKALTFVQ